MASRAPLSEVVRSWRDATGGGLNAIQTRELIRALEAQEAAVRDLGRVFALPGRQEADR